MVMFAMILCATMSSGKSVYDDIDTSGSEGKDQC